MEVDKAQRELWSNTQAYGLAIICLLLGVAAGYVAHGPTRPVRAVNPVEAQQQPTQQSPHGPGGMQVTPEQLEHMAVKQAEPMLAELEKNPNNAKLLAEVGRTYLSAHQFQTAIEYYEKSVKIKPDPRVLTTLGGAYHYAGSDDKALDAWNRALKIDPNNADALFNFGLVKWKSESDPNAAIAAWSKILKAYPNHPQRARVEEMIARAKAQIAAGSVSATGKNPM